MFANAEQELMVVYEDDYVAVVNKPAGCLCHHTNIAQGVDRTLMCAVQERWGEGASLVHRLDRPTAGLLIVGKQPEAAVAVRQQFADKTVYKEYWAVCRGWMRSPLEIDYPLRQEKFFASKSDRSGKVQEAFSAVFPLADSRIDYVWERGEFLSFSLVKVLPRTGRTHQIRRHLAHVRHPIVGDTRHGDSRQNRMVRDLTGGRRLGLVAKALSFDHPITGERIVLEVQPDEEFLSLLAVLGLIPS